MIGVVSLCLSLVQGQPIPALPVLRRVYCAPVDASYCDKYWIDGPAVSPGQQYPLIVMFHGHGETHDPTTWIQGASAFMDAATAWTSPLNPDPYFVVMHDGGRTLVNGNYTFNTYGCEEFHAATEAVIEDVVSRWPIDENRIYGYGLSMGGGEVLAFAARHQDPTSPTMLAAVVDQSGTISMTRTYVANPGSQAHMQDLYETGPYGLNPWYDFRYQRATALDLPFDGSFSAPLDYLQKWGFHLAHNLRWVSRANFHVTSPPDVLWTMVEPVDTFEAFLADTQHVNAPDQVGLLPVALNVHRWDALAPSTVLAYFDARDRTATLGQFSIQMPSTPGYQSELLLFSEDGVRHHCFSIQRTDPNLFGRLHVKLYPPGAGVNALVLALNDDPLTDNVADTSVFTDHLTQVAWSTPGNPVLLYAPDADIGTIHVIGVSQPSSVEEQIGGQWVVTTQGPGGDWTWSGGQLNLFEKPSTGLQRYWRIHS